MACGSCGRSVVMAHHAAQARVVLPRQSDAPVLVRVREGSSLTYNNTAFGAGEELTIPRSLANSLIAVEILG